MLDKYEKKQSLFYNFMMTSLKNNRISHAYLIETNEVSYALDLALDMAKFFIFETGFDERINQLIDEGNYPNLVVVNSHGEVKKDVIKDLMANFSLKSTDGRKRVYIISDVTLLNKYSSNSLLKFLEEPEEDIIAILLTSKVNKVLRTITSRTQIISLVKENNFSYKDLFLDYYAKDSEVSFDLFVSNFEELILEFYNNLEKQGVLVLENRDIYQIDKNFKLYLLYGLYLYYDALNIKINREKEEILPYCLVKENIANLEIDDIIKKIEVINKFLFYSYYNVNMNLFIDNFIISMGG